MKRETLTKDQWRRRRAIRFWQTFIAWLDTANFQVATDMTVEGAEMHDYLNFTDAHRYATDKLKTVIF